MSILMDESVQTLDIGESANGVAYGGGSVWVTNSEERAVVQVNPDPLGVVQTIRGGERARSVAVGQGAVWVANTIDGTLSRIDLAGGATKTIRGRRGPGRDRRRPGCGVGDERGDRHRAAHRSALRERSCSPSASAMARPASLSVNGAVWVANRLDGTVSRIDPATNSVSATIPEVGANPTAVAAGLGAVWVANCGRRHDRAHRPGRGPRRREDPGREQPERHRSRRGKRLGDHAALACRPPWRRSPGRVPPALVRLRRSRLPGPVSSRFDRDSACL